MKLQKVKDFFWKMSDSDFFLSLNSDFFLLLLDFSLNIKEEPDDNSEIVKRTYKYSQHGSLTIMGWSENLEKIELFCLVVFLPVDKKKGEKPKDTLIVFKNGETFEKIGTKSFLQMGHIEVQIKNNEATLRLPQEDVSLQFTYNFWRAC